MHRLFWFSLFLSVSPATVFACATCGCGDPTLTQFGTEKPFPGRTRISLEYLDRGETTGEAGVDQRKIYEKRTTLGLGYAYSERLLFGVRLPFAEKRFTDDSAPSEKSNGIGDVELSGKWFLQSAEGIVRHDVWGLQFGLRVPTAKRQKENGQPLDIDAQPGTHAWAENFGAFYGHYAAPWFFYASGLVQTSSTSHIGDEPFEPGDALTVTGLAQYAINPRFSVQMSLDGRWTKHDVEDGVSDADSGGFFAFISPGFAYSVVEDVLFNFQVQIPAINDLDGRHKEHRAIHAGLTYDF